MSTWDVAVMADIGIASTMHEHLPFAIDTEVSLGYAF
jgi:hypothetical protein